jgi:queuosine precursor transporter
MMDSNYLYYDSLSSLFVASLLISNIVATKLVSIGPFIFTGGILIFPITYIFGDVFTELYGFAHSRKIIWTGFFSLIALSVALWIVGVLPPAASWQNQEAYSRILGIVPRVAIASIIGYLAGEFANSYCLIQLKILTKGKYLWVRTIGSTLVGEFIDTILFVCICFAGITPWTVLAIAALSSYVFKVAYEVLATPLTYKVISFLKQREHCSGTELKANFNPFKF